MIIWQSCISSLIKSFIKHHRIEYPHFAFTISYSIKAEYSKYFHSASIQGTFKPKNTELSLHVWSKRWNSLLNRRLWRLHGLSRYHLHENQYQHDNYNHHCHTLSRLQYTTKLLTFIVGDPLEKQTQIPKIRLTQGQSIQINNLILETKSALQIFLGFVIYFPMYKRNAHFELKQSSSLIVFCSVFFFSLKHIREYTTHFSPLQRYQLVSDCHRSFEPPPMELIHQTRALIE